MHNDRWKEMIDEVGGILRGGHYVGVSGVHMEDYIQKREIFAHPTTTSALCYELAVKFADDWVDVVVSPSDVLSQWLAFHLARLSSRRVLAVLLHKDTAEDGHGSTGRLAFKYGQERHVEGKNVLAADDTLHTAFTATRSLGVTRQHGGNVVGFVSLWNRGGVTAESVGDVPRLVSAVNETLPSWSEEECARTGPCSRGVPIDTLVGHGAEFLARKK